MCYEEKTDGDGGVMGEVQGLGSSEEEDARANDAVGSDNNGPRRSAQDCHGLQVPQLPPQNVIRWDRFLPLRSLKVLLVENDDSTRQVVSALLRNCSYEVTDVANGIQAWKILEDLNNHFDLVLTEVVMPTLSGIGLLCKIMSHKTLKNIPVIMMSSNDSMGVVFKCLSKGAVDFLVKPIRKNELKNLWQHVWRRCYCSSGSGSESGTQTKKSLKSKSVEESENHSDSSDELDDYGSNPIRDGSDNGSGTQSSWTKRVSPTCQFADAPDSTCAQVIHTRPENWATDDIEMAKELSSHPTSKKQNRLSEADSKQVETGQLEQNNENTINKPKDQAADTAIADINCINHLTERKINASSGPSDIYQPKGKACCDFGELPSLELSLNGLRQAGDGGSAAKDDRHVLRRSDLSAFSKYNTACSANQGPTGNVGSCSPLDNSSVAMKTETMQNALFHLSGTLFNQLSNGSTNSNDVASTAKNICPKPETLNEKSESTSAFKSFYSSAFQTVQNGHVCLLQQVTSGKVEGAGVKTVKSSHQHVQVQHHHHYHRQHHHHIHSMQQRQSQAEQDDISLNKMAGAAPQCGSSNVVGGPTEVNGVNYSVNGSASGSNHGSNGQNGSSALLNTGLTNIDSENRNGENSEPGRFSERISGNAIGEDRVAQREAALSKFRQKRKERCFEKKVRYQSRKRLAEQRPRVKGQFVRQIVFDAKAGNVSESNDLTSEDNSCDSVR